MRERGGRRRKEALDSSLCTESFLNLQLPILTQLQLTWTSTYVPPVCLIAPVT